MTKAPRKYNTLGEVAQALGGFSAQAGKDREEWRGRLERLERAVKLLAATVVFLLEFLCVFYMILLANR